MKKIFSCKCFPFSHSLKLSNFLTTHQVQDLNKSNKENILNKLVQNFVVT